MPVMAIVTLINSSREEVIVKVEDTMLYERNINEGDKVCFGVNNKLEKADSTNVPNNTGEIDLTDCYVITQETFDLWGLNKIKLSEDEKYLVKFNESRIEVEVYNTKGYDGKYSLTQIES